MISFDPFTIREFLFPLEPLGFVLVFVCGFGWGGIVAAQGQVPTNRHWYWLIMAGVVFFVPQAVLRSLEGSLQWERLLATFILWVVFVVGMEAALKWRR